MFMELIQLFLYWSLALFTKNIESLFNTVLGWGSLICDDVGWWSGFNKIDNNIDEVGIGFGNTVEGMGNNN